MNKLLNMSNILGSLCAYGKKSFHILIFIRLRSNYAVFNTRSQMRKPFANLKESEKFRVDNLAISSGDCWLNNYHRIAGSSIGVYANMMAREGVNDNTKWNNLIARSKEVYKELQPVDIALILNSLSRSRRCDPELFNLLVPHICKKAAYYTSIYIAMVISAYAKNRIFNSELYSTLKNEIKSRLYEFVTPIELCMVVNACSKFKEDDEQFLRRLSLHLKNRLNVIRFTPQELSVLAYSFASMDFEDAELLDMISAKLSYDIGQTTAQDAIRVLHAFLKFRNNSNNIQEICKDHISEQFCYMPPKDLMRALYSFGKMKDIVGEWHVIKELAIAVKLASMKILNTFQPIEVVALLQSHCRWSFELTSMDLSQIIERMIKANDLDLLSMSNVLISLLKYHRQNRCTVFESEGRSQKVGSSDTHDLDVKDRELSLAKQLLAAWSPRFVSHIKREKVMDIASIVKIAECFNTFGFHDVKFFQTLKHVIISQHLGALSSGVAYVLYEVFSGQGYDENDDFMELLSELKSRRTDYQPPT